jgi:transposase-like protein
MNKLLLFYELLRLRILSKFNGFDQAMLKLFRKTMRCLHLDIGVSDAD